MNESMNTENSTNEFWGFEEDQFTMVMHLSQFAGFVIPYAGLALPIVMWATNKDKSEKIDKHGKVILNWIISTTIYLIASVILMIVIVGFFTLFAVAILCFIFPIIGAIKAKDGEVYRYPLSINFLK